MSSRREFLKISQAIGLSIATAPFISSCHEEKTINGKIVGGNAALGHRLRTMDFPAPSETIRKEVVIVGGGIAGLSAARYLSKKNIDFALLELETNSGGNSASGKNATSAFPWGAHYLPLPSNADEELISFLQEENVITGVSHGLPTYNEYYLCHDPKERLFINNFWQEGIVPHEGVPKKDREEIQKFLEMMNTFKNKTGTDGKPAFAIPVDTSSTDLAFTSLDKMSAKAFLSANGFSSEYLLWYVSYCCADDFGTSLETTSAWAMIHYFASRRGKASNAGFDTVLTWPEGNAWLAKQLIKGFSDRIICNTLCYNISMKDQGVQCRIFDAQSGTSKIIEAKKVILCTPQFINKRLLTGVTRSIDYNSFQYAPWMVANITTNHSLTEKRGEPLCWDNVFYGSDSLGYVNATHQEVGIPSGKKVITYYKPLASTTPAIARQQAYTKDFAQWSTEIFADLTRAHKDIRDYVEEMNVWLWGHGMITPSPGFTWSDNRRNAATPLHDKIFFAHSDLSGLSIFEEAFYRGHQAAKAALQYG
ncbi:MAG TPA: FAD-dependent oxidoreductase [Chryseosolibacter sp.]